MILVIILSQIGHLHRLTIFLPFGFMVPINQGYLIYYLVTLRHGQA